MNKTWIYYLAFTFIATIVALSLGAMTIIVIYLLGGKLGSICLVLSAVLVYLLDKLGDVWQR